MEDKDQKKTEDKQVQLKDALNKSETLSQAIVGSLTENIAVLDAQGRIVAVNTAWERFAQENGAPELEHTSVGLNYLEICRQASEDSAEGAAQALAGIQAIIDATLPQFTLVYPCHSPSEQRWFLLLATPLNGKLSGAVVAHVDITEHKQAEVGMQESVRQMQTAYKQATIYAQELRQEIIERRQAEEALQHYADRLEILRELDQAVLASQSPAEIAQSALRQIRQMVPCQRANVTMFDFGAHQAVPLALNITGETKLGTKMPFSLAEFGGNIELLRQGRPHVIQDVQSLTHPTSILQTLQQEGIRSLLFIPLMAQNELIGSVNIGAKQPEAFSSESIEISQEVANSVAMAIQNARLFEAERAAREQLRDLARYLQKVREEQRAHIAREIHDELGQALTALKIDLSWITDKLSGAEALIRQKAETMKALIDSTIEVVQRIASELRPGMLDDLGLLAAIEWQAQEFAERTGVECELHLPPEDLRLDQDLATTVFRIFQEALTNVARHAKATRLYVELKERVDELILIVRDNGGGIIASQVSDPKSLGLIGMRERAAAWDGQVTIQGVAGQGTTVTVRVARTNVKERSDLSSG